MGLEIASNIYYLKAESASIWSIFPTGTQIVTHVWVLMIVDDLSEDHKCVPQDVCSVMAAKILGKVLRVALVKLRFWDRYK